MININQFIDFKEKYKNFEVEDTKEFHKEFIKFKGHYCNFIEEHQTEFTKDFKRNYSSIHNSYKIIKELIEDLDKRIAQNFNIFSILDNGRYEVRTHTPFLAELLNPKGSHGQQNLFLSSFLVNLLKISKKEANDPDWVVKKEFEYIDLRIVNTSLKKAIFIENKIYTDVHSAQLSRYFKLWKNGYFKGKGSFIYLTPNGDEPSSSGFNENIYPGTLVMDELILLSYKNHISAWLKDVYSSIQSPKVQETINQYIELINIL